jgi:hypothetical protein
MPASNHFRKLLKADSSAALPTTEDAVDALFDSYRVRRDARPARSVRSSKPTADRLELSAAILWFHTHVNDPGPALDGLPFEMKEKLVECFVPDFVDFAGDPKWPTKLSSFFKFATPSDSTPQKRAARSARAQASAGNSLGAASDHRVNKGVPSGWDDDLDSEVEGIGGASADLSGGPDFASTGFGPGGSGPGDSDLDEAGKKKHKKSKKKKSNKKKKSKHSKKHQSGSSSSSSSDSSPSDAESGAAPPPSASWSLPAVLSDTKEFAARVEAAYGGPEIAWVPSDDLIRCLTPTDWLGRLYLSGTKSGKSLRDYEKYLKPVLKTEDRNDPLWVHRLSLGYVRDNGFELDAKHLALVAVGESPSDFAGSGGFRDSEGLKSYLKAVKGLQKQWSLIQQASDQGVDPGEAVYGNFRSQFLGMYTRRYARMHSQLLEYTSSADKALRLGSREVLSHSARQCLEIKDYLQKFFDDVSSRAGTVGAGWSFQQRAAFVHSRVGSVFGRAVRVFLESEGAASLPATEGSAGAAALGGSPAVPQALLAHAASPWPVAASPHLSAPAPVSSWGPPPPYFPPGPPPSALPGYALSAGALGVSPAPVSLPPQGSQPPAVPHPFDGVHGPGAGSSGGQQRAAKRTLQVAFDGAGQGGSGAAAGAGRGDGLASAGGVQAIPSAARVRFDPVVRTELQQGGGGEGQGHLAQPAHVWILGKYAPHAGPGALQPECTCWKKYDVQHQRAIGAHARWDCPLRYIAQCGHCPGFTASGLRQRSSWIDHDTMTADTVAEWKRLIEARDLKPARGVRGAPSFP